VKALATVAPWIAAAILLGLWETAARLGAVPAFLAPAPSTIFAAMIADRAALAASAWTTAALALQAAALAFGLGVGAAMLFRLARPLEAALSPFATLLQATPIIAIAPLVLIWVGVERSTLAILILGAIVAFFPALTSALAGFKAADAGLRRLFALHRATAWQRIWLLELPSAAPYLAAGLKTSTALALVGVVTGEFVAGAGGSQGLAWRIIEAANRLETPRMFAALAVLLALAALLHAALSAAEARLARLSG
jgi:NitT/TauT family transport system permease protein